MINALYILFIISSNIIISGILMIISGLLMIISGLLIIVNGILRGAK